MNGHEFSEHLLNISHEAERYISEEAPTVMGKIAVDHFKEGFQNEGFTDSGFEPWQEVKRRMDPLVTGAKATRAILTGDTGDLGESINYGNPGQGEVTIYSDKAYAEAHNKGTNNAGRNRNVFIPKRQFIGDSVQLNQKITDELRRKIGHLFK